MQTAPRTRVASLTVLLGLLLALMLAGATSASAHAALLSSDPAQNAVVQSAPTQIVLHFSEQVTLATDDLRVFDPSGKRVDSGPTGHNGSDDTTARVALASGLAQGTYTVAWRAVSADTHPVSGAFTFSYGHTSSTTPVAGEQPIKGTTLVGALYGGSRTVQYAACALLVGSVALVLLCWPAGVRRRSVQRLMLAGWAGLLLATVAELLLRGPYEAATGIGQAFDLTVIQRTLSEHLGTMLVVRMLLLAAAGVFLSMLGGQNGIGRPAGDAGDSVEVGEVGEDGAVDGSAGAAGETDPATERRLRLTLGIAGAVIAIALACTWALADHASVGIQVGLAVPLDVVHILAMSFWLGGLATVLVGLRTPVAEGGIGVAQVRRFSAVAMGSVSALVATGVYQAWRGLGSWGALTSTTYGRLLLVKIGAVVVILAAAWMSRRWTALLGSEPEAVAVTEAAADTAVATATAEADPAQAPADEPDPVRRAQLERQDAARRTATAQRVREASPARGMLLRSVLLEVTFAVIVLIVTTLLTNAPPGRSVSEQAEAAGQVQQITSGPADLTLPFDTGGPGANAKGKVSIEVDPARVGSNVLHAYVYDSNGKPVDEPELDVTLTLPAKSLGPLPVKLSKLDIGHWAASALQLPMAGSWQLSVSVRSDAIDETTVTATMNVSA
ncbi:MULTISPECIES: copper resistance protein CopC [Streptacidiphilus]|uniref:Copper resistance protein CopC n=1 Tax=Streptacidiphilus cavernicola TaxID=3342716 RepID=A0ABV6UGQ8_9ACTN|nr:copper resistance protein CopC [Streptacidiphilus jeojiense]